MKKKLIYIPPEIIPVRLRDDIDDIILSGSEEETEEQNFSASDVFHNVVSEDW